MTLLVYITAVVIYVALSRQRRRFEFELGVEYKLLGIEPPNVTIARPMLETLLTLLLGIYIFGIAILMTIAFTHGPGGVKENELSWVVSLMLGGFLAGGATMAYFGVAALLERRRH